MRSPRPKEKDVEAGIVRALRTVGCDVTKTSQPRASMITAGVPDLYVQHRAWRLRLWVEVKRDEKAKPTQHQLEWHAREREAGGAVVVAWSVEQVLGALVEMGAPLTIHARR
jgi:hypothetical protein